MDILIIGKGNIENIANAIRQKYQTLNIYTCSDIDLISHSAMGNTIDRAIIFDTILTEGRAVTDIQQFRQQVQHLISDIKKADLIREIVCITQSDIMTQYFLEELYDIQHYSAVFQTGPQLPVTDIMNYAVQSMRQLRQTSIKEAKLDIYQSNDSVIWSDNKTTTTNWRSLGPNKIEGLQLDNQFRLNIALDILDFILNKAEWEYIQSLVRAQAQNTAQQLLNDNKQQSTIKEKKPGFFARLFGRKKNA